MLFKFLWKGPDKVTRRSTINEYDNGRLKKMIYLQSMIKQSLLLAWIKKKESSELGRELGKAIYVFFIGTHWSPLFVLLQLRCKRSLHPFSIYSSLLQWWSEFRDDFDTRKRVEIYGLE